MPLVCDSLLLLLTYLAALVSVPCNKSQGNNFVQSSRQMTVAAGNAVGACINKLFMTLTASESSASRLCSEARKTFPVLLQPIKMFLLAKKGDAYLRLLACFPLCAICCTPSPSTSLLSTFSVVVSLIVTIVSCI